MDVLRVLLDAGADIDAPDDQQRTPLMVAAAGGHLEVVRFLVKAGATPYTTDAQGKTVLDYADMREDSDVSDYLQSVISGYQ